MAEARNVSVSPSAKLPIGATISATIHVFKGAPFKFIVLILLPVPFSLAAGGVRAATTKSHGAGPVLVLGLLFLIQYAITLVSQCAAILGASRLFLNRGEGFRLGEALRAALARFLPLLGVVVLAMIIIGVGLVLLIVPGIIFALMLSVAFPACAIEGLGSIESLRRSRALTRGNRWRILGTILLVAVVPFIILFAIEVVLIALHLAIVGIVLLVMGGLVLAMVLVGFPAVLFHALRAVQEGSAPERVSRVFA